MKNFLLTLLGITFIFTVSSCGGYHYTKEGTWGRRQLEGNLEVVKKLLESGVNDNDNR